MEKIAEEINIPFTVGGGISEISDVDNLLKAGADKISINSSAVKNPDLIKTFADKFGVNVVVAIDSKQFGDEDYVFVNGGRIKPTIKPRLGKKSRRIRSWKFC